MKKKWSLLFGLGALLPVAAVAPVLATSCGTKSSKSESTVINEHQLVQKTLTTNTNADAWAEKIDGKLHDKTTGKFNLGEIFSNADSVIPSKIISDVHTAWPDSPTSSLSSTASTKLASNDTQPEGTILPAPLTVNATLLVNITLKNGYTFSDGKSKTASVPILVKCTAILTPDLDCKYTVKGKEETLDKWVGEQQKLVISGNYGSVVDAIINHEDYKPQDKHFFNILIDEEKDKGFAWVVVSLNDEYQFSGGHGVQFIKVFVESKK